MVSKAWMNRAYEVVKSRGPMTSTRCAEILRYEGPVKGCPGARSLGQAFRSDPRFRRAADERYESGSYRKKNYGRRTKARSLNDLPPKQGAASLDA